MNLKKKPYMLNFEIYTMIFTKHSHSQISLSPTKFKGILIMCTLWINDKEKMKKHATDQGLVFVGLAW
jgi:hypothetical protein